MSSGQGRNATTKCAGVTPTARANLASTSTTRSAVNRVTLSLANTSVSYRCYVEGIYSCSGTPRDQNEPFVFSASAIR